MIIQTFVFLILVSSCSTRALLTGKYPIKDKSKITSITFIPQEKYHCGPASLAMMFSHLGEAVEEKNISSMVFTPEKKGSFQSDMISAVRRKKFLPLQIKDFKNLLLEVDAGNPVLILQNLGLKWIPRWHYAVVIGYDLKKSEMILHSGTKAYMRMSFFTFNKIWDRSENWGILVLRPGTLPLTVSETELISEIAKLEELSFNQEARLGYESALRKFPGSLGALIGLGNIFFNQNQFPLSIKMLNLATASHPGSAEAWHNLALAYEANHEKTKARKAAQTAVSLSSEALLPVFKENLKTLLN